MDKCVWQPARGFFTCFLLAVSAIFVSELPLLAQGPEKQAASFDLLVNNATVVTMDPTRRVIEDGVIAVNGDTIVFV